MKTNTPKTLQKKPLNSYLLRALQSALIAFSVYVPLTAAEEQQVNTQDTSLPSSSVDEVPMVDVQAAAWLEKMQRALRELNYQISFVLLKPGSDASPYIWRHGVRADGVEMEQLNLLNGPGSEVVRLGNRVSYFEPNVPQYTLVSDVINGPLPSTFFRDPLALKLGYDFVTVGRSRVSGRSAQQIRVVSKDKNRFGFNLWLDQQTGLPLKVNVINLKGKLVEQIQVTELSVTDAPHAFFERIAIDQLPRTISLPPSASQPSQWQVSFLPKGMEMVRRDIHRLPITGSTVEYMMFSDGLVDVSIYMQLTQNRRPEDDVMLRFFQSDTFLIKQTGPVLVTVIGKIPAATANAIASSIRPASGP